MKLSSHTSAMPWCMLVALVVCQTAALKAAHSDIHSHAADLQAPQVQARTVVHTATAGPTQVAQIPAVSCCVVIVCFLFVVVYTALAICRTYHELTKTTSGQLEAALRAAAQALTYGPMLCALFIACQVRVEDLSDGFGQPQAWVQKCMSGLILAVLMSTLLALVIQSVTAKPIRVKDNPFDMERASEEIENKYQANFYVFTGVRYLVLFALYVGLAAVIVGINVYRPAKKLTSVGDMAPAVTCTIILAVVFFATQFVIAVCRTFCQHTRMHSPQIVGMMHATTTTMEYAPALATLFLVAHMRAAEHDAELDDWVQNCMLISTAALCTTTAVALVVPLMLCGNLRKNPWTNELFVEVPKPTVGYIFMGLRFVCLVVFYGSAAGVMLSIFTFESPGPKPTMAVSPTVQCVVNMTCQFFFVYFVVTLMETASELTGGTVPVEHWTLFSAIDGARSTLAFAPVLSILFITTRMHAISITDKLGAPAPWVQDAMYLATWALQMTGVMCLATGLFMAKTKTDYYGNVVNKFSNWYSGAVVVAVRFVSMLVTYGGMAIVILGLLGMTPESASEPYRA